MSYFFHFSFPSFFLLSSIYLFLFISLSYLILFSYLLLLFRFLYFLFEIIFIFITVSSLLRDFSFTFLFFFSLPLPFFPSCSHFYHSTFTTFLSWGLLAYQQKWSVLLAVEIQPTVTRPIPPFPASLNPFLSQTATVIPYVFKQSEKPIPLIIASAKNHFLLPYILANLLSAKLFIPPQ